MMLPVETLRIPNDVFFAEVRNFLASGQSVTIRATGRSMSPTFKDSVDVVVVSPCEADSIAVGDAVLFDRGDTICLHRVIERNGDRLVIRGDGNAHSALEYATIDKVLGKVTGGTMKGGKPFRTGDACWERNTRFVLRCHRPLAFFRRVKYLLKSYPASILVLALLFYLSFFNPGDNALPEFENSDKIAHLIMYCGLSSVFWFEWLRRRPLDRKAVIRGAAYCFALPVLLGGLIEVGQQYLVSYRDGDWLDFLANTAGCVLALAITYIITVPLIRKLKSRKCL